MPYKDPIADAACKRAWYENHRGECIERSRQWRASHHERHIANSTRWNTTNLERRSAILRRSTLRKYDITQEEYDARLIAQGGRCAICRTDKPGIGSGRYWCIDHDHVTGEFRGLLCRLCNVRVGWYEKLLPWISRIVGYLSAIKREAA